MSTRNVEVRLGGMEERLDRVERLLERISKQIGDLDASVDSRIGSVRAEVLTAVDQAAAKNREHTTKTVAEAVEYARSVDTRVRRAGRIMDEPPQKPPPRGRPRLANPADEPPAGQEPTPPKKPRAPRKPKKQ